MRRLCLFLVALAALCGAVLGFIIYDTPMDPGTVSPPYNTPREDTAHYLTEGGEIIHADH